MHSYARVSHPYALLCTRMPPYASFTHRSVNIQNMCVAKSIEKSNNRQTIKTNNYDQERETSPVPQRITKFANMCKQTKIMLILNTSLYRIWDIALAIDPFLAPCYNSFVPLKYPPPWGPGGAGVGYVARE